MVAVEVVSVWVTCPNDTPMGATNGIITVSNEPVDLQVPRGPRNLPSHQEQGRSPLPASDLSDQLNSGDCSQHTRNDSNSADLRVSREESALVKRPSLLEK